jgi:VanZ family protein
VIEPRFSGRIRLRLATTVLVVYWFVLLVATHWPYKIPPQPQPVLSSDKLLHFLAYAGLGFLIYTVAQLWRRVSDTVLSRSLATVVSVVLITAAAGLLDEWTQPLFARDFEWYDWAADCAGALCGVALAAALATMVGSRTDRYEFSRPAT